MLNILMITDKLGYEGRIHGVGRLFLELPQRFDPARFRIIICALRGDNSFRELFSKRGLALRILGWGKFNPLVLLHLLRIVRNERIDLLHVHGWEASFLGRLIRTLTGKPVVIHLHDLYLDEKYPWYLRWSDFPLRSQVSKVIAVSRAVAMSCKKVWRFPEEKIEVVHNGVPMEEMRKCLEQDRDALRSRLDLPPDALIVGTVTRLTRKKGNRYFIEAASLVLKDMPHAFFLLAGEGPERAMLENQARRLGIQDRVRFMGFRSDVTDILAAIDIKVLSSLSEGLSGALIEAKALGRAIIAASTGGVPEIITDNQTGLLIPPGNSKALADRILRLLKDPEERRRLGEAALWDSRRHDIRVQAARIGEIYEKLV